MLPLRTFTLAAVICTVHLFDAETLRQLCLFVVLQSISWVHRPELECEGGEFLGRRMCALLVCTGECVESVWSIVQCVERDSAAPAAAAAAAERAGQVTRAKDSPQAAPTSLTQPRAGVP